MTVAELIAELRRFPATTKVMIYWTDPSATDDELRTEAGLVERHADGAVNLLPLDPGDDWLRAYLGGAGDLDTSRMTLTPRLRRLALRLHLSPSDLGRLSFGVWRRAMIRAGARKK